MLVKAAALLVVVLCSARAAAIEGDFTVSSFTAAALDDSPEVRSAYEAYSGAQAAYKSAVAAMILPTAAFSAQAYPYGENPANGYKFQAWRLNHDDVAVNTTLNLNIFNSFQDVERVRSAKLSLESAERAYFAARQDRALAAIQAFYDLDTKLELSEVARENLKAQEEQYNQSVDLYNNGMKSLADLLKSETDWRSSQLRLLDAQADEQRSRVTFNTLIERPGFAPETLTVDLKTGATTLPELDGDLAKALAGRPEVVRARADLKRAQVAVEQAVQGLLPTVRFDATWNHEEQATFGVSAASLGIPDPNYYVGLSVSLPGGFNVFSQVYGLAQAKAQRNEAQSALVSAERQARGEVYGAYISLQRDTQAYELALQKEDIARRTLDIVSGQYREGTADAIRMNQAQNDFLNARVEETLALHSIFTDRAQYKRAVGEPLW